MTRILAGDPAGRPPRIVAGDLSLTATGLAWTEPTPFDFYAQVIRTSSKQGLSNRLDVIAAAFAFKADDADVLIIEDVPFGQYGVPIAMVHGAVRYALGPSFPIVTIPPATLKKYATGRGNARKPDMLDAARSRLGWRGSNDDNVIDALWLLAAGLDWYGQPLCSMPKANHEALHKIDWPAADWVQPLGLPFDSEPYVQDVATGDLL